jgi:hypothetical protein
MAGIIEIKDNTLLQSRSKVMSYNRFVSGINLSTSTDYTHIGSSAGLAITDATTHSFLFSFLFKSQTDTFSANGFDIFQTYTGAATAFFRVSSNLGNLQVVFYSSVNPASNARTITLPQQTIKYGKIVNLLINKNGSNPNNWSMFTNNHKHTDGTIFNMGSVAGTTSGSTNYFGTNNTSHTTNSNIILLRTGRFNRILTDDEALFVTKYDGLLPNTILTSDIMYYHPFKEKNGTAISDIKSTYPHTIVNATTSFGPSNQWLNKHFTPYTS